MPTNEELKMMQALPLDLKIRRSQQRIREWVNEFGVEGVYISFSGGKDSTVLLDLVRGIYGNDIPAVFVNTGLEFPEVQKFVKTFDNMTILTPKMRFDEVIRRYGYPFIGKEVAQRISELRTFKRTHGTIEGCRNYEHNVKAEGKYNISKWLPLLDVDFCIDHRCCATMKKQPTRKYYKETGRTHFVGTTTEESLLRRSEWLKKGCNAFEDKYPHSAPISFWTEQDVLQYVKEKDLPICSVYGDVVTVDENGNEYDSNLLGGGCLKCTGRQRTGCVFCGFGAHREKGENRFQLLKKTHPKQYEFCMEGGAYDSDGLWKPNENGLGMRHCIDVLNSIYGEDFIRY